MQRASHLMAMSLEGPRKTRTNIISSKNIYISVARSKKTVIVMLLTPLRVEFAMIGK